MGRTDVIPTVDPAVRARLSRLRWTAYGLGSIAFVLAFFHRIAPAAISSELQQAFSVNSTALGVLAATYFYTYTLMQVPSGVLADTLGPRFLFTIGALVAGAGSILFGVAESLAWVLAGRTLVGLGVSVAFVAVLKLNAAWFPERQFATMTGVLMFVGNLGGVLSASPLAWLVTVTSWRNVFVALGLVSIVLGALIWLFLRDSPKQMGLPSMRELAGLPEHAAHSGHWMEGLATVLCNPRTWPCFLMNLGMVGGYLTFAGLWVVPYLREVHGMSREAATRHQSLMILCFAVGCLVVGWASDRLGRRLPLMRGLGLIYVLCWIPWIAGIPVPGAIGYALFALMGFGIAGVSLGWSCAKEVNPPALSGMATSVVNTGGFLGPALFQPLVGWLIDRSEAGAHTAQDYEAGLVFLMAVGLLGWLATFWQRETWCRYVGQGESGK
jgi:sugar phosphate permease